MRHYAQRHDEEASFPAEGLDHLARLGFLHQGPARRGHGPLHGRMAALLRLLAAVGRGDLNVGRIFEGHVNALDLIDRYGTPGQRQCWLTADAPGLQAVWATDDPANPLRLEQGGDGRLRLRGAKAFASGVDGVAGAIVTAAPAGAPAGTSRLVILRLDGSAPVDRSRWRAMGMRASGSHVVSFDGVVLEAEEALLGTAEDYLRQPWFSGGAIRFAAVHLGGAHALFDVVRDHLTKAGRDGDPYQRHRLAELAILVEQGYGLLARAAVLYDEAEADPSPPNGERLVAYVNMARVAIEKLCLEAIATAERAVGCAGMIAPHPLQRVVRDLATYLRQPNPDKALAEAGAAAAAGVLSPGGGFIER